MLVWKIHAQIIIRVVLTFLEDIVLVYVSEEELEKDAST